MKLTIVSIIIAVLLFSCTEQQTQDNPSSNIQNDYRKGTSGLVMAFLPELPPATLFNTYPLTVMVEYRNSGATTIDNGIIYVSGYDTNYIKFDKTEWPITNLEGKSISNPNGLFKEIAEFKTDSVNIQNIQNIDSFTQTIRATACYIYKTSAFPVVCIDPNAGRGTISKKICNVHSVQLSGGQGAPISITRVDEEMAGGPGSARVIFKISIKNDGKGTVFNNLRGITNCHTDLTYTDVDTVTIDKASFSQTQLTCKPNPLRLDKGEGTVICMAQGDLGRDAYTTPLDIELSYGYRESIETPIKIINLS